MHVKIDSNYSPAEVQALLAALVTSKFLTPADLGQGADRLHDVEISFFDINTLLLPFSDKFVWYNQWQKDTLSYELGRQVFYTSLTEQLLQACPLVSFQPTCQLEVDATPDQATAILRAGSGEASFCYTDYLDYVQGMVKALNTLLANQGFDAAYYEVGFDDGSGFLLLSAWQYDYLLTNRVVLFAGVLYPEIEAWRAIPGKDLPF